MGWQTIVTQILRAGNTIINAVGDFIYSGPPASGNLAASIVPGGSTVTDPQGNTAQPGITSYGAGAAFAQLQSGQLNFRSAAGQSALAIIFGLSAGELELESGAVSGGSQTTLFLLSSDSAGGGGTAQAQFNTAQFILAGTTTVTMSSVTAVDLHLATIDLHNGNLNLNMADPPNTAAVIAGTATQAQYNACLGGMLNSMKNRQLFA